MIVSHGAFRYTGKAFNARGLRSNRDHMP